MPRLLLLATLMAIVLPCSGDFAVAAYLPEWRYEGANWDVISRHVSHLILFSLEPTAQGSIGALDRLPRPELMQQARAAASAHNAHLMICFGGNGRSAGFSAMVRDPEARKRFVANVAALLKKHDLDGVDYNWEYPGYQFGRGYLPEPDVRADYTGLGALFAETRAVLGRGKQITMSYYPDTRQEAALQQLEASKHLDLLFSMSYDQGGAQHSSVALAQSTMAQIRQAGLPARSMCLGVPFYGRSASTGDWTSYEDIVQRHHPLAPELDQVAGHGFNGFKTIELKTTMAIQGGLGGVMIWEVGQDCRLEPVTHGPKTHPGTCPAGEDSSLLVAITRAMEALGTKLAKAPAWVSAHEL